MHHKKVPAKLIQVLLQTTCHRQTALLGVLRLRNVSICCCMLLYTSPSKGNKRKNISLGSINTPINTDPQAQATTNHHPTNHQPTHPQQPPPSSPSAHSPGTYEVPGRRVQTHGLLEERRVCWTNQLLTQIKLSKDLREPRLERHAVGQGQWPVARPVAQPLLVIGYENSS